MDIHAKINARAMYVAAYTKTPAAVYFRRRPGRMELAEAPGYTRYYREIASGRIPANPLRPGALRKAV